VVSCAVPPAIDEANLVDNPKIVVNRTVLLECPVSGSPVPDVVWLKNGEPLSPDANMNVAGRHLEIIRARVTDSARYTCVASNEAGELRRSFDLEVLGLTFTLIGWRTDIFSRTYLVRSRLCYRVASVSLSSVCDVMYFG